jgi:uncharacterized repeat protein (TIGR03803 family)
MTTTVQHAGSISRIRVGAASAALVFAVVLLLVFISTPSAQAQVFKVLYNFTGGNDGANPYAGLIISPEGNLYGTTRNGGFANAGTVFEVDPNGNETVQYSFSGGDDGAYPLGDLILDAEGNLYSTTESGGFYGYGVVFKLDKDNNETVLYSFTGGDDGGNPTAGLQRDAAGNLYGTTEYGGAANTGTVFKVAPNGHETVLHSFTIQGDLTDGTFPYGGVSGDSEGNLIGTTEEGGASNLGTVFKVDFNGKETLLHSFTGKDGSQPISDLVRDKYGNLYGTANHCSAICEGTVFKLDAGTHLLHVLHGFTGGEDGAGPAAGVNGFYGKQEIHLYGTTQSGGPDSLGTLFEVSTPGKEIIRHYFTGRPDDGATPYAPLLIIKGAYYGTTWYGGTNNLGTVFKWVP